MSKMTAIYRKELAFFFNSIIAYVVLTIFLLIAGYFFYNLLAYFNLISMQAMQNPYLAQQLSITEGVLQPLFGNISIIMLLILPLLTMRLLSEERKSGTAELLFTYPISDWDVLLGKYCATLTVFAAMLGCTLLYPLLLGAYADPEAGPLASSYLGLFLLGMSYISMGLFFSSISENQIVAGVLTFGQLSILEHLDNFTKGVIDTNDIVYYVCFSSFFLFCSSRVLESNRWRS
ncbi:MAG: ABC transporter permease [Chitinivibrionia bacterium]|nr:ABC transporter permease [Chitinivibrionia bacterium]